MERELNDLDKEYEKRFVYINEQLPKLQTEIPTHDTTNVINEEATGTHVSSEQNDRGICPSNSPAATPDDETIISYAWTPMGNTSKDGNYGIWMAPFTKKLTPLKKLTLW